MQRFYLTINLWPSLERTHPTQLEGSSPIVWTMLHPPTAAAWLSAYSWEGGKTQILVLSL